MEQSDEILRLLAEIRDLQREHFAEYRRISEEAIQINRAAAERADAQYRASLKSAQASAWGIFILIAVCVAANLFMLSRMARVVNGREAGLTRHFSGPAARAAEFGR